MYLIFM
uniref:Leader peptide MsrDL n=1 Tax=Streptococcus pneumoniae TaxID=1313 RepID=MSRDL_STREE